MRDEKGDEELESQSLGGVEIVNRTNCVAYHV